MESVAEGSPPIDNGTTLWLIVLTIVFAIGWYGVSRLMDWKAIASDWPKYRCSPSIMPFASLYGYDTTENFQYCIQSMMAGPVGAAAGPFATILSTMIGGMMSFLNSLMSLKTMLATMVGGVSQMFQEFSDRFKLLSAQVRNTGLRMQMLMQRVFATFFSVIYMALSAITAGQNFGDTFIFKFIDTFCFAPETPIQIVGKGWIPIADVRLGDVCERNGAKVLSTYRFQADGQPMVRLGEIHVSTNHYVQWQGKWIQSRDHPDAIPIGDWKGGEKRPLICLDTENHTIPIGPYLFSDWDETSASDEATMKYTELRLNAKQIEATQRPWLFQPAFDGSIQVRMKDDSIQTIHSLKLHDELSTGTIVGIGKRLVYEVCRCPSGQQVTPSTLIWAGETWKRAGHLYPSTITKLAQPIEMVTLIVFTSACIEGSDGTMYRDMCEVHDPDVEQATTDELIRQPSPNPFEMGLVQA